MLEHGGCRESQGNNKLFIENNVFQLSHGTKSIYQASCGNSKRTGTFFFTVTVFEGL